MQYAPALNPPGDVHRLDHSFSFDFKQIVFIPLPAIHTIFGIPIEPITIMRFHVVGAAFQPRFTLY
jgi:hypothetical protein